MKRLDNKVAIVTGASKGIGAGIAKAFGAEGAAVIVNYARDQAGAERVVREIIGNGGRAVAVQGDVAQRSDAQRLVAEAVDDAVAVDEAKFLDRSRTRAYVVDEHVTAG
jgi:3-oxoacyl-[acyl-carrier protein] reductase